MMIYHQRFPTFELMNSINTDITVLSLAVSSSAAITFISTR